MGPIDDYRSDLRGNRLEEWSLEHGQKEGERHFLMRGPSEVANQLVWVLRGLDPQLEVLGYSVGKNWNYRIDFTGDPPTDLAPTCSLLSNVLSLRRRPSTVVLLALAYHYDAESLDGTKGPERTAVGQLVYEAKYLGSGAAYKELVVTMADVVKQHPMYAVADGIVSVPGHDTRWQSPGETIARKVARHLQVPIARGRAAQTVRQEAKAKVPGGAPSDKAPEFYVVEDLTGRTVIAIDDVYRSGSTMEAIASAARRAGAIEVLGLVATRTLTRS